MSLKNLGFKISISKMVESHREIFWLIVSHPDYVGKGTLGKEAGTMTPYMSQKSIRLGISLMNMLFYLECHMTMLMSIQKLKGKKDFVYFQLKKSYQIKNEIEKYSLL